MSWLDDVSQQAGTIWDNTAKAFGNRAPKKIHICFWAIDLDGSQHSAQSPRRVSKELDSDFLPSHVPVSSTAGPRTLWIWRHFIRKARSRKLHPSPSQLHNSCCRSSCSRTPRPHNSLNRAFAEADKDNSGTLDFNEFAAMHSNRGLTRREVQALFHKLDSNRDGTLDMREFERYGLHGHMSEAALKRKLRSADALTFLTTCCVIGIRQTLAHAKLKAIKRQD